MSPIRAALLDAAYDAAVSVGWGTARMADVAAAAGVSRQTLYTEFGTKDGLAQALALREATRFVDGSEAQLTGTEGTPSEAVAASTEWTLRTASNHPLIKAALTEDGSGGLLPYLTTRSDALIAAVTERHVAYLRSHWPDLPDGDLHAVADTVVRLIVSHIVTPADPADVTAKRIAHLVDRLLPGGDRA